MHYAFGAGLAPDSREVSKDGLGNCGHENDAFLGTSNTSAAGVPKSLINRSVAHVASQPPVLLEDASNQEVLATVDGAPIWVRRGRPGKIEVAIIRGRHFGICADRRCNFYRRTTPNHPKSCHASA